MDGIELVTEGVHTVNNALEILEKTNDIEDLVGQRMGRLG